MTAGDWLVPLATFEEKLEESGERHWQGLARGSMRTLLYKPRGRDEQQPHSQDEVYIVISGSGTFLKSGERRAFGPGDVIFVEAGAEHRFEDFEDDFASWVVFWGPPGGESA